jgi:hypothetical protein
MAWFLLPSHQERVDLEQASEILEIPKTLTTTITTLRNTHLNTLPNAQEPATVLSLLEQCE